VTIVQEMLMNAKRRPGPCRPAHPKRGGAVSSRRRGYIDSRWDIRKSQTTSIWRFSDIAQLPGTSLLAGWLARTVLALVTGHTEPGDRVLLLQPPRAHRTELQGHDRAPYRGLGEAVWPIVRMGRGVADIVAPDAEARPTGNPDWATLVTEMGPGRFELIVTATTSGDTMWLDTVPWNSLLAAGGVAAVVSRSAYVSGRFVDPVTPIVRSLCHGGRAWLDHIAVIDRPIEPIPDNAKQFSERAGHGPFVSLVHHDLLLFTYLSAEGHCMRRDFKGCRKTSTWSEACGD
jgi:hypothetical protein